MMNVLYHKFIDQIKQQEIEKYQRKHQQYFKRCGKMINVVPKQRKQKIISPKVMEIQRPIKSQASKSTHAQPAKQRFVENVEENIEIQPKRKAIQETQRQREIKGASKYQFNQHVEEQIRVKSPTFSQNEFIDQFSNPKNTKSIENKPIGLTKKTQELPNELPNQNQEVILVLCPENCGRKFEQSKIQKHIKICQKVFQQKRKVFKVKVVDQQAENIPKKEQTQQEKEKKKKESQKWKKQSQNFRNQLKGAKPVDDRVECRGCHRKFNEDVLAKHEPSCLNKNKNKK